MSNEKARLKRIKEANKKWIERKEAPNNRPKRAWNTDFLRKAPCHIDGTFMGKVKDES